VSLGTKFLATSETTLPKAHLDQLGRRSRVGVLRDPRLEVHQPRPLPAQEELELQRRDLAAHQRQEQQVHRNVHDPILGGQRNRHGRLAVRPGARADPGHVIELEQAELPPIAVEGARLLADQTHRALPPQRSEERGRDRACAFVASGQGEDAYPAVVLLLDQEIGGADAIALVVVGGGGHPSELCRIGELED
jgi:hypothetical protein